MSNTRTVFLAGIMQGSLPDTMHEQTYRAQIAEMLHAHLDPIRVYDPFTQHPESLTYDLVTSQRVFLELMERAGQADLLVAFLPEASMGTAIEMWMAHHAGAYVVAVTPLEKNWVVMTLADTIVPDLDHLRSLVTSGALSEWLSAKCDARTKIDPR